MGKEKGPERNPGWDAIRREGDRQSGNVIDEVYGDLVQPAAAPGKRPPEKKLEAPPSPDLVATTAAREGKRAIAGKEKSLAKLDRYKADWPAADKLKNHAATGTGGFKPDETCKLTGGTVNFRRDDGSVEKRLNRGSVLTVSAPLQRIQVLEEVFIRVRDKSGNAGYVAERFLKPIEARKEFVAQKKGKLETTDAAMFREVVLHHLDDVFGTDEDLAKDPSKRKLKAQKDGLYAQWDVRYSALVRKGVTGDAFDEGVKKLYRDLFGNSRDIFEEKVQLELALASGARKAGTEVVSTSADRQQALDEVLNRLGYEIGIYFGKGKMTAAEIRQAFSISGPPNDNQREWGNPGSRVVFSYTDGKLYFYPPKANAVSETVPFNEARFAWVSTGEGGGAGEIAALEGQRYTTREKSIGVRQPRDDAMEATREKRVKQFVALQEQYKKSQAGA